MPDYLDLDEFKAQRRIDSDLEDDVITRLLNSAEARLGDPVNGILRRPVVSQEFTEKFSGFDSVELAYPDNASISDLSYESAGVMTAVGDIYTLENGKLVLTYGESWPTNVTSVSVTYTAGWDAADVPEPIKDAGYFIAGQLYDNEDSFDSERFRRVLAFMVSGYRRAGI